MDIVQIIGLITFLGATVYILSLLKPIGGNGVQVDWSEYKKCQSGPERKLFEELARHNFYMKCQVPLGRFKLDFLLPKYKLVIEVDSAFHDTPQAKLKDARKDAAIRAAGYEVVRVRGENFSKGMDEELSKIMGKLDWKENPRQIVKKFKMKPRKDRQKNRGAGIG